MKINEKNTTINPLANLTLNQEITHNGLGVSAGIAIGPAHVVERGLIDVPEYTITESALELEVARFDKAVQKSIRQIQKLQSKASVLEGAAAEELLYLLDAHLQMLRGSRLVRGVVHRIRNTKNNAEASVQAEFSQIAEAFSAMGDNYLAGKIEDVREVSARLLRNLTSAEYQAFSGLPLGTIIIAEEITPADTALMDPNRIGGFTSTLGGAEGHTAIMARSLGLPAVLGAPGVMRTVKAGDIVIIDGVRGQVIVKPSKDTINRFKRRRQALIRRQRQLRRLQRVPAITKDGTAVRLQCNMELPSELELSLDAGAEGIGLLRSEFLYMNRHKPPSEDEQYVAIREILEGMNGCPVTVRTLDIGSDKLAYSLGNHISPSVNPALGLRAIRLSLKVRPLLETQIAAMLRACNHGEMRILLPMITSVSEIYHVRQTIAKVVRRLRRRRIKLPDELPKIGIMIETPGAAIASESLAQVCDFFSIGTNDLTMYTLAVDRGDEQVANLYNPLHPAVLRLIQMTVDAAKKYQIPVNLCGEMAGNPKYSALLIGLGLRNLSMAAPSLPRVKQRIIDLNVSEAYTHSQNILKQSDTTDISNIIDEYNSLKKN
ncbi:MAG: phosphoenolpyruvate--protein phosphotransferase [Alphaproteobacteria bacterium]|nr:phosphoenolpyruvate--protein phosphotransferase [Alphaproteobacteria bacterium]|tara:strand:+ start:242 stop:2050 length:1809 start_codon:yes stop_codon:yes gene_type:complete